MRVSAEGTGLATPEMSGDLREPTEILAGAAKAGRTVLLESEVYALVGEAGIAAPRHRLVTGPDEIDAATCAALGRDEAVVKIASPDLLHKSDVSGVRFCANHPAALREATAAVLAAARAAAPRAVVEGVLLAERVPFRSGLGREMLAAFRHDPAFGPVVVIGAGGLDSEVLLSSLQPGPARAMFASRGLTADTVRLGLRSTLSHRALVRGLRSSGGARLDEERLVEFALALARLAERWAGFDPPEGLGLVELEMNPVVLAEDGRLVALDGLARAHRPDPLPPARPVRALSRLLEPRSAVVIGASAQRDNPGRVILRNLASGHGLPTGRIWALHPNAPEIEGCRAFASLDALPEPADLAIVSVPADQGAERVVREIVEERRAHTITLISGGFGETVGGREAEARIRAILARSHSAPDGGVRLNGGNCLGIISEPGGYNTFFIPAHKLPVRKAGSSGLAWISQSGAYLVSQISNLEGVVSPRYAISFGNQMDVTVADYLAYLEADPGVTVFAVYLEGFQRGDGQRFLQEVRRITDGGRTVLLYKAGRTREGSKAAASHTAAAVGDFEVCEELARAAGAVTAASLDAFADDVLTFTGLTGRRSAGRRVAVLTNAGFEAAAAGDALAGLELATLDPKTRERLARLLPQGVIDVHNPVDATPVTATPAYAAMAAALAEDEGVDALVVAGIPATPFLDTLPKGAGHAEDVSGPAGLATLLTAVFRASLKPMVFSVDSGALYDPLASALQKAGLPTFRRVDRATRALSRFVNASRPRPAG